MKPLICLLMLGVGLAAPAATNKAYKVAHNSLASFKASMDAKTSARFGFASTNEVAQLKLDAPLPHYQLLLKELETLKTDADVQGVLAADPSSLLFPLTAHSNAPSAALVAKKSGLFSRWKTTSFGDGKLARLFLDARQASMATTGLPRSSYVAVSLPEVQVYFLGYPLSNQWMVLSVVNAPEFGITSGTPTPAVAALGGLGAVDLPKRGAPE